MSPHYSCLVLGLFGTLGYLTDDHDAQLSMLKFISKNNIKTYQFSQCSMNASCSEQGREQKGQMWGW